MPLALARATSSPRSRACSARRVDVTPSLTPSHSAESSERALCFSHNSLT